MLDVDRNDLVEREILIMKEENRRREILER